MHRSSTRIRLALAFVLGVCAPRGAVAGPPAAEPPKGFTALFNGKDLSGFYGLEHFDPRKLRAMSDGERTAKRKANDESFRQHWSVENGELVNDGNGRVPRPPTRSTATSSCSIEYKTVAKADSGIYLRGTPQVQIWDYNRRTAASGTAGRTRARGGLWNNSAGAPGKRPARARRQAVRRVEQRSASSRSASAPRST